jgi:hypothetical protein
VTKDSIHKWESTTVVKALFVGAVVETVAIAPAILSPWGHAGPEAPWGWLGLVLNVPGLFVIKLLRMASGSKETVPIASAVVQVYVIQALIFSYIAFVLLRWKQRRSED